MYLVFDIGGTHIRIAPSKDGKDFSERPLVVDTPKEWKEAESLLTQLFSKHKGVQAVCGGLPGVFDEKKETLVWSPNLPDWVGKPIVRTIQNATGVSPSLYNDAMLAGVGEATAGAGKGRHIVAYLTISTGVGGARIIDGRPDNYRSGFEPGQQIIDVLSGKTLEQAVSGSAFARRFGLDFVKTAPSEAWTEAVTPLALGIYNTILHWSPDIVVLGGSMMTKPPAYSLAFVEEKLLALPRVFPKFPELALAELGDENGLRGALAMFSR